jgi:DNA-binding transcriptional LysR family regulator
VGIRSETELGPGLASRPLFRRDFVVAARKGHPLRNAGSLARLAGAQWLTLAPRGSPGGVLEQAFSSAGLAPPSSPLVQCESYNGIVSLLASTDMLTLTSRRMLAHPFARDLLQEIPVTERLPPVTHGMFTRADAPLTPVAAATGKAIASVARGLARRSDPSS